MRWASPGADRPIRHRPCGRSLVRFHLPVFGLTEQRDEFADVLRIVPVFAVIETARLEFTIPSVGRPATEPHRGPVDTGIKIRDISTVPRGPLAKGERPAKNSIRG